MWLPFSSWDKMNPCCSCWGKYHHCSTVRAQICTSGDLKVEARKTKCRSKDRNPTGVLTTTTASEMRRSCQTTELAFPNSLLGLLVSSALMSPLHPQQHRTGLTGKTSAGLCGTQEKTACLNLLEDGVGVKSALSTSSTLMITRDVGPLPLLL